MKEYVYQDVNNRGTIRRIDYVGARESNKYALVYLPFGYDSDLLRRYDILYLMHGGSGNPDSWLDNCQIKNLLDLSFASGEAEPMIVVFPTFYTNGAQPRDGSVDEQFEHGSVITFQMEELTERLIPAVEGAVRGYAESTEPTALKNARTHRGFGGFSMGGVNTWYTFSLHLEYFSVFLPLSGNSWSVKVKGGSKNPGKTAQLLRNAVFASGFGKEDYSVFAATGTNDIAFPNLTPQIEAMKTEHSVFSFSEDYTTGNLHYLLIDGLYHSYEAVCQYIYNYLPYLFRKTALQSSSSVLQHCFE